MKERYIVAPLALLSGACTLRPFTPSVSVAYWAQDVPHSVQRTLPDSLTAITRWQLPVENPWSRYEKFTLLSSLEVTELNALVPEVRELETVRLAECAAGRVAAAGLPDQTAWIVDVRGAASVTFGASLSQLSRRPVSPVITFNNWPAEDEVIPAEETLAALITMQPRIPQLADGPSVPVFLLDAWRLAYRFDEVGEDVTDNRYMLSPADLPDPQTLRAQGITQVIYLVENLRDTEVEEDDLNETMVDYQNAGIRLIMLDLPWLCGLGDAPPRDWTPELAHRVWRPTTRVTLGQSLSFFQRSRGGFGGIYAGPSPWRSGGHFHANHGGG